MSYFVMDGMKEDLLVKEFKTEEEAIAYLEKHDNGEMWIDTDELIDGDEPDDEEEEIEE